VNGERQRKSSKWFLNEHLKITSILRHSDIVKRLPRESRSFHVNSVVHISHVSGGDEIISENFPRNWAKVPETEVPPMTCFSE
jgi:hypothetical protein